MGKLVFVALQDQGHFNVLYTIGKYILANHVGHEIYFVTNEEWDIKVRNECNQFKTIVYKEDPSEITKNVFKKDKYNSIWLMPLEERLPITFEKKLKSLSEKTDGSKFEKRIDDLEPDLVLFDDLVNKPFLMNKKYPWGVVLSSNPITVNENENLPSIFAPTKSEDHEKRNKYYKYIKENLVEHKRKFNEILIKHGCKSYDGNTFLFGSDYINVYNFPEELNYFQPNQLEGRWFQVNSAIVSKEIEDKLEELYGKTFKLNTPGLDLLTYDFLKKPGKLILFTLGTIVTRDNYALNYFLKFLNDLPHKFIVSKGKLGDEINLPSNCVGANYLDLKQLLPRVDFIITHGGNNTLTECFYYGVPLIVIPFHADQFSNAIRVDELGYGIHLEARTCTTEKLQNAIQRISEDVTFKNKIKQASERIQKDKSMDKFCEVIVDEFLNK